MFENFDVVSIFLTFYQFYHVYLLIAAVTEISINIDIMQCKGKKNISINK